MKDGFVILILAERIKSINVLLYIMYLHIVKCVSFVEDIKIKVNDQQDELMNR